MHMVKMYAPLILVMGILFLSPNLARAEACVEHLDQASCDASAKCAWGVDACYCASPEPLDILFLMDASGSVGSSNWKKEKDFVINMIESGISEDSSVALVRFASQTSIRVFYSFTDLQGYPDGHTNAINVIKHDMSYTGGSTYMKTAVATAIDVFSQSPFPDRKKLLVLITDGNPTPALSQDPCNLRYMLDEMGIQTVIVGVGSGIQVERVDCLIDDPATQFVAATDFNSLDMIRASVESFTCPTFFCGDGLLAPEEACDDGNLFDDDGCDSNCTFSGCGNGIINIGEECDDGNLVDDDGCESTCILSGCGNGFLNTGEECDDGNLIDGDGCESDCRITTYSAQDVTDAYDAGYDQCLVDKGSVILQLQTGLQECEAAKADLEGQLAAANDRIASLETALAGANQTITDLNTKVIGLQDELAAALLRITGLETDLAAAQQTIADRDAALAVQAGELEQFRSENSSLILALLDDSNTDSVAATAVRDAVLAVIDQAVAAGGNRQEIRKVTKEMTKGERELARGNYEKALEKFIKAYEHAIKATEPEDDDDDRNQKGNGRDDGHEHEKKPENKKGKRSSFIP